MAFPTNPIYKLIKNPLGIVDCVMTKTGSSEPYHVQIIPFDEENSDYQEYLKWKAIDGNEPEAAD